MKLVILVLVTFLSITSLNSAYADHYVIIKPTVGQIQKLLDVQDSNGNTKVSIDKNFNVVVTTPTTSTSAQISNHLGLLGSLVTSPCVNSNLLAYQISNTTWPCTEQLVTPVVSNTRILNETIITNFGKGHGWAEQTANCVDTDDTSDFVLGNQSLKMIMNQNTGLACFVRSPAISPALNLTSKEIVMWVKFNDTVNPLDVRLTVTADAYANFRNYYLWGGSISSLNYFMPNEWYKVIFSPTQSLDSGSPNMNAINSMQFRIQTTNTHALLAHINTIAYRNEFDYPIISFTFDDGYNDQFETARPILDKYHYPATAFVITSTIGTNNAVYMTIPQLQTAQDVSNWDISAHTVDHVDLTHLSQTQLITELHDSKLWLLQNGFNKGADFMAYPFGAFNKTVITQEQHYYRMARTISETPVSSGIGMREVLPPADPYRLRVVDWTNNVPVSTIENAINKAIANHDWLIFENHHVVNSSASQSTQILATDFQLVVDYIHTKEPNVRVETISQVLNDISTTPASPLTTTTNVWSVPQIFQSTVNWIMRDITDATKQLEFDVSSIPTGHTITAKWSNLNNTVSERMPDNYTAITGTFNSTNVGQTELMYGDNVTITPILTGTVMVEAQGTVIQSATSTTGCRFDIRNFTASSDGSLRPVLGTVQPSSSSNQLINSNGVTADRLQLDFIVKQTNARVNQKELFDLGYVSEVAGTCQLQNPRMHAWELP